MRFLDFLTGFVVCAVFATLVASWGIDKIRTLLQAANKRHDEMQANLNAMRDQLDKAHRELLKFHRRRDQDGRFVKRGA